MTAESMELGWRCKDRMRLEVETQDFGIVPMFVVKIGNLLLSSQKWCRFDNCIEKIFLNSSRFDFVLFFKRCCSSGESKGMQLVIDIQPTGKNC